ncbi:MAG: LysM peptidoglycan-binding domain-containing protein, partial [Lachnospiraceae bacterium]|nr:LysM peptidoglycan-binding domain-containing protein [Lachnospiraceae bacterium]
SCRQTMPFHNTMDVKGILQGSRLRVYADVDQSCMTLSGSGEAECHAQIRLSVIAFDEMTETIIRDVTVTALDREKMRKMPSMAVYIARDGDSLWDIGKRYYIPVGRIKEINGLTQDVIRPAEKLLIVRM